MQLTMSLQSSRLCNDMLRCCPSWQILRDNRSNCHFAPLCTSIARSTVVSTRALTLHRLGIRRCEAKPATSINLNTAATMTSADSFIQQLNDSYEKVHKNFEDQFWATKMNLQGCSSELLSQTKTEYDNFLGDPGNLQSVRSWLAKPDLTPAQRSVLSIMEKTFKCYITEDPKAVELKSGLTRAEADLAVHRNNMALGYVDPTSNEVVRCSSVQLRDKMRTSEEEGLRKACYEGLRSVGPHVVSQLCEIVKMRNQLGRMQGYEDYYDYKVSTAEGFGKAKLFEIMDGLEQRTRDIMVQARERLASSKGASALEPWNMSYALSGDVEKAMDPYFPFEDAVDVWSRCFAALGIGYKNATMTLDLCDREGKYSNGFCHWPQPAWRKSDGTWVPSSANFTSLATPNAVGSGKNALATLLHEGGHAAHFANIDQGSPFFSQERAPTSVAYAETQSMFLDSLMGDADWMAKYATNREGEAIPWTIVKEYYTATQPYQVFMLRSMLAVPYFEKALYELPEDEVTPDTVLALADKIEQHIQGGLASRPLLSVPHILSDEASAYYHGYVLAEMAVHQTRQYFQSKYGYITDNPNVGKELAEVYWQPGNGAAFLELVEKLTGKALTGDAWVAELKEDLTHKVSVEEASYNKAKAAGPAVKPGDDVDLNMRVVMVHGDDVIADSAAGAGLQGACATFKHWVRAAYFKDGQ